MSLFQPKLSDKTVIQRGLVTEQVKAKDIVKEHGIYCDTRREVKNFRGETLAYVTPVSPSLLSMVACTQITVSLFKFFLTNLLWHFS